MLAFIKIHELYNMIFFPIGTYTLLYSKIHQSCRLKVCELEWGEGKKVFFTIQRNGYTYKCLIHIDYRSNDYWHTRGKYYYTRRSVVRHNARTSCSDPFLSPGVEHMVEILPIRRSAPTNKSIKTIVKIYHVNFDFFYAIR